MTDLDRDALRRSLDEGVITQEQYEALRDRMRTDQTRETGGRVSRRLLWAGLLLLALLAAFFGVFFLGPAERVALLAVGMALSVGISVYTWRDPSRSELSRGFLGLTMFEVTVLLLLARGEAGLEPVLMLAILLPLLVFGLLLGIYENSTWLASPSAASLYLGVLWSGVAISSEFVLALFVASTGVALLVLLLLAAWHLGKLQWVREAYLRREASLGQLGRGHLVLYVVLLFLVWGFLGGPRGDLGSSLVQLAPFAVALVAVLYAWRTDNTKLLNLASLLLVAVAWAFIWTRGRFGTWPLAVLVTAGVLIFLGLRGKLPKTTSTSTEGQVP